MQKILEEAKTKRDELLAGYQVTLADDNAGLCHGKKRTKENRWLEDVSPSQCDIGKAEGLEKLTGSCNTTKELMQQLSIRLQELQDDSQVATSSNTGSV